MGCSGQGKYKDGTYTGTGKGLKGDIEVSVQVKSGKISTIEVVKKDDTDGIFDAVKENLIPDVIKKQTTEGVDTVSGATGSSKGALEAINNALTNAKK
jgi:uncharacterized protein with FMN-binding domain